MKPKLVKVGTINFPTIHGDFLMTTYETHYENQKEMKYALAIQTRDMEESPLIRIHSSCFFSEVLGSMLCDCAEQLSSSLKLIAEKKGILFYLDQEGRGHGLHNKTLELQLQQTGLDTVEASKALNLEVDSRDYTVVSDILNEMGIKSLKIITNNPKKIAALKDNGFMIKERIPTNSTVNEHNKKYLSTKKDKLGHLI